MKSNIVPNLQAILLPVVLFFSCLDNNTVAQIPPVTTIFPEGKNVVEIPFTRYRSWIIIKMQVNNKDTLSFILDTGAPIAVFADVSMTERLGLNIIGKANVTGGDGKPPTSVDLAGGVTFNLAGIEMKNCIVAVGAASDAITGIDGVIGKYVFDHAVVEINWEESKLVITKPEHYTYKGNGKVVPIEVASSGHIYSEVVIEKNGKKKTVKADIDTGNRSTLKLDNLTEGEIYKDAEAIKNIITGWGANGPEVGDLFRVNLFLGDWQFTDVVASSKHYKSDPGQEGIAGNIGLSILERFTIVFNYPERKMILEKNALIDKPFGYTNSGILLHPAIKKEYALVAGVIPGSPAEKSGLQKDDRVIAINGKPLRDLTVDEIDDFITGRTMNEIVIEIKRAGGLMQKKIVMQKLL